MIGTDARPAQVTKYPERTGWLWHHEKLADWTWKNLVNRTDAYGRYTKPEDRGKSYTRRDGTQAEVPTNYTSKCPLTPVVLKRHFRCLAPEDVIGLHSTSQDNRCRWCGFDIDRHDEATDPALTHARASRLYRASERMGFRPLLTDSNGDGGYHLLLLFKSAVPSADAHHLAGLIAKECGYVGETYPKQRQIKPGGYGNWLRLPGKHHSRDHLSKVFDGEKWLAGFDAVNRLVTFAGDDPSLVPAAPPPKPKPPRFRLPQEAGGLSPRQTIVRYIARCPNLCTGQGRDDVAYNLAAFLVRDMQLSDPEAMVWLSAWDRGNNPPKGDDRLKKIMENVHEYGRNAYGSSVRGGAV